MRDTSSEQKYCSGLSSWSRERDVFGRFWVEVVSNMKLIIYTSLLHSLSQLLGEGPMHQTSFFPYCTKVCVSNLAVIRMLDETSLQTDDAVSFETFLEKWRLNKLLSSKSSAISSSLMMTINVHIIILWWKMCHYWEWCFAYYIF